MTDAPAMLRALTEPFLDPASRTFLPSLVLALGIGAVWTARRLGADRAAWRQAMASMLARWRSGSSQLDLQLLGVRQLLGLLTSAGGLGLAWTIAVGLARWLDHAVGVPERFGWPDALVMVGFSVVLFVAWDLSRYLLHRAMHEVSWLWPLHQVHHTAEVLTPLTFFRLHPLEGLLYQLRGGVVTGVVTGFAYWLVREQAVQLSLLGVHAGGLLLNAVTGNLRHSHVAWSFGPRVERWLISPAQHQLHHGIETGGLRCNYGTWLALWDRLGGSLVVADHAPSAFGLPASEANHAPDDLVGALWQPIVGVWQALRPRWRLTLAAGAAVALAVSASAAEPIEEEVGDTDITTPVTDEAPAEPVLEEEEDDEDLVVVVETKDGGKVPRAAGSAHIIDQQTLEQFEYNDIHRVLARVPGVYVRGEDGFGLRPNIGIRGANSDRSAKITLMEDGVLFAPAPYAAPAAYFFPMATRMVGVEVFKGPAAIRYGPNTVGGALNLRTRSVPTDGAIGSLDVAGGLRATLKVHGFAGVGNKRAGLLLEGVTLGTRGFKTLDGGGPTGFTHQEFMAKAFVASDPDRRVKHRVELKAGYTRERSHETYLGLSVADYEADPYRRYAASARDDMRWNRSQAELTWELKAGRRFELRTTAYHHFLTRQWFKLNRVEGVASLHDLLLAEPSGQAALYQAILAGDEDSVTPEQQLWLGTNDRRFHAGGLQVEGRARAGTGFVQSETRFGLRLHLDDVVRLHTERAFDMRSGQLVEDTSRGIVTTRDTLSRALAFSAHVTEDLGLGPIRLLPGTRLEVIRVEEIQRETGESDGGATYVVPLPGMGIHGSVLPFFDLFAGVHRGFTPVGPGQPAGTRPESSVNVEAGARLFPGETYVEVTGFFNDYQNLSGSCTFASGCDGDQVDVQYNAGQVYVFGLETVLSQGGDVGRGVHLSGELSYTFTGSRFRSSFVSGFPQFGAVQAGDQLPYVPVHQGGAAFTVTHPWGYVTLGATARSAMRDVAGQGSIPDDERIDARAVLDLAVGAYAGRFVDLYVTADNLTNATYVEALRPFGLRPGQPFQVMVGAKLHTARDRAR